MFISFIVPVYNTEKYLYACLDSLLDQDLSPDEYEIICINDGSTDNSLAVLKKYEVEYKNIFVINQRNSGVCQARNAGLLKAKGEYIWFIDSDDVIEKHSLKRLKTVIDSEIYDRIIVDNYFFESPEPKGNMKKNTSWHDSVVWRNIFSRRWLEENDLKFHYPELVFGEDALFMYEIKRCFPKTYEFSEAIYYHRGREGSASSEEVSTNNKNAKLLSNIKEAKIMKQYYENDNRLPETADRLMSFLWGSMYRLAELPGKEARPVIKELKVCGLYPYKRPADCTIRKSGQAGRADWIANVFDRIYTNMNTRTGYCLMRLWIRFFRAKQRLLKNSN